LYKKILEFSEQADLIDEIPSFNAIKDTLPRSMISDKAKNVYLTRLRREDVKTISDEFALIPRRRRRHRVEKLS
jgi:hypothetical protein